MKDFLFQCIEIRKGNSIFSLEYEHDFFEDAGWDDFFGFLVDYANFDTVHYTLGAVEREKVPEEQIQGCIRYPRNISISEYLTWRFQKRVAIKERIKHRNIVSKMKLIITRQPDTEVLFRSKPSEVSKYDWTRN